MGIYPGPGRGSGGEPLIGQNFSNEQCAQGSDGKLSEWGKMPWYSYGGWESTPAEVELTVFNSYSPPTPIRGRSWRFMHHVINCSHWRHCACSEKPRTCQEAFPVFLRRRLTVVTPMVPEVIDSRTILFSRQMQ